MLFPHAHALLHKDTEFLCTLGLQRWRSTLLREFRAHTLRTHGIDWGLQLRLARSQQQSGGLAQETDSDFLAQTHELLRDGKVGEAAIRKVLVELGHRVYAFLLAMARQGATQGSSGWNGCLHKRLFP
jgi:hypothetical protein